MDFLQRIFNFSLSLYFFPSVWKTTSIISIHKTGKPLDSPVSFRPISLTSCVSKLFECIVLSRLLFFLESNSVFSLPTRPVSALNGLHSIKFCSFLSPFRIGQTNPSLALGRFLVRSTCRKLSVLFRTRSFPHTYFGWPPSLLCSLDSTFPL